MKSDVKIQDNEFPGIELIDGIIYLHSDKINGMMNPTTFVQLYGKDVIRKIKRDISEEQLEKFLSTIEGD